MRKSYWITIAILSTALIFFLMVGTTLFGSWNNIGWGIMGGWPAGTMHGWSFGSFGWFGMLIMLFVPVGIFVLAIIGIVWLVRSFYSIRGRSPNINQQEESQTSLGEILQIRYANGEITREQYMQILEDLN
jgi:uncharacterized membrane protein